MYNLKLDTSLLFIDSFTFYTDIGIGRIEISEDMVEVIKSIKEKKYKTLLQFVKNQIPEIRLYGLLGIEMMVQKKIKLSIDLLKYSKMAKNIKGKVHCCQIDLCSLEDYQEVLQEMPKLAKEIIKMHHL